MSNVSKDSLFELRKRAEKVVDLIDKMHDNFPLNPRENKIVAIMACIQDAYKTGLRDNEPTKPD